MKRVYLVHGTWPNGPFRKVQTENQKNWFHPNNDLSKRIFERLGDHTEIFSYIWSGKNSVKSRSSAAKSFAEKIQRDQSRIKADQIYIVAHSHGGTVAAECLHNYHNEFKTNRVPINGVVCLATPFIFHDKRIDADKKSKPFILTSVFSLLFILQMFIDNQSFSQSTFLSYLTFISLLLISIGLSLLILNFLMKKNYSSCFCIQDNLSSLPMFHLIRSSRDEASGLIGFASFFSWMLMKAYTLIEPRTEIVNINEGKRKGFIGIKLKHTQIVFYSFILLISYLYSSNLRIANELFFVIPILASSGLISLIGVVSYIIYMLVCGEYSPINWLQFNVEMEQAIPGVESKLEIIRYPDENAIMRHSLHSLPIVQERVASILYDWGAAHQVSPED